MENDPTTRPAPGLPEIPLRAIEVPRRGRNKLAWEKWYWADWLTDPCLRQCEPETRGIWADALNIMMATAAPSISGTVPKMSRLLQCTEDQLLRACTDLKQTETAIVTQDSNGIVTIVSRRREQAALQRIRTRDRVLKHRRNTASNTAVTQPVTPLYNDTPCYNGVTPPPSDVPPPQSPPPLTPPEKTDITPPVLRTVTPQVGETQSAQPKRGGFKTWGQGELQCRATEANADGLLSTEQLAEFCSHWCEPSSSGRPRFSLEKTWDTRLRIQKWRRVADERSRRNGQRSTGTGSGDLLSKMGV